MSSSSAWLCQLASYEGFFFLGCSEKTLSLALFLMVDGHTQQLLAYCSCLVVVFGRMPPSKENTAGEEEKGGISCSCAYMRKERNNG